MLIEAFITQQPLKDSMKPFWGWLAGSDVVPFDALFLLQANTAREVAWFFRGAALYRLGPESVLDPFNASVSPPSR